ncbi:MAG: crotonase [Rhodococcus sp.]|uniref:enoyl-CoA hydratase-related protein n=1 Tax=Mycolicibacterium holsaticum TaxID=152142 RepID=UPI0016B5D108|nr:enoyl-CoA hydratase-related protein [Mycolicibacterium holsaticum]MDA4105749.1 crotonase [Mycolicibacterium holsaticum DSM 44478 = JCM 12374]NLE82783.1 crotonase [Rhodococcus sp. (in: high G+C Gram-positive bacteria)]QZA13884.1 enoyl-CoA hydratase/isomerase family protein [Mycolicibacterium holsaticum DSM 44478 = JCM 12374]UNC08656.1 enoyl-CoA hydratase/isomerase family protein [Mycolicibacterium holsaticum DSM 44478 = JCM 12374]
MSADEAAYQDLLVEFDSPVLRITINRPEAGNKFRDLTAIELADVLRRFRSQRELRVAVLTGAGDKFFCIGGEHDPFDSYDYGNVMPIVDVYELIDSVPKPIIAAVNGYAVGGGNVLHTVCDLSIASERAQFRQVGPSVGSFDAGYGTAYLEETIGRKRAKEMWYLNRKYTAEQALAMGLVNEVTPHAELPDRVNEVIDELLGRGPQAIAGLKAAFSGRHTGIVGQARMAHDLLLTQYLRTEEAQEMSRSFRERQPPDPTKFWT